jgi:hypothetical protein
MWQIALLLKFKYNSQYVPCLEFRPTVNPSIVLLLMDITSSTRGNDRIQVQHFITNVHIQYHHFIANRYIQQIMRKLFDT